MNVLFAILAGVLILPMLLLVGIALGPAALVILFIVGFALIVTGVIGLIEGARSRYARHKGAPPLHR